MRKSRTTHTKTKLQAELNKTNVELGQLNHSLATQMITLAAQTGELTPLLDAVKALRSARNYYTFETNPIEHADVQQALADTLLMIGKATKDKKVLQKAKQAYRAGITVSSMLGDEVMREDLRSNYKLTLALLGEVTQSKSLFKVA